MPTHHSGFHHSSHRSYSLIALGNVEIDSALNALEAAYKLHQLVAKACNVAAIHVGTFYNSIYDTYMKFIEKHKGNTLFYDNANLGKLGYDKKVKLLLDVRRLRDANGDGACVACAELSDVPSRSFCFEGDSLGCFQMSRRFT